jgi:hypothetical protein
LNRFSAELKKIPVITIPPLLKEAINQRVKRQKPQKMSWDHDFWKCTCLNLRPTKLPGISMPECHRNFGNKSNLPTLGPCLHFLSQF